MVNRDLRYSKRGVYVPFAYKECPICGEDINPPRGPRTAYKYCAKCCIHSEGGKRARLYKQRRLAEVREIGGR